MALWQTWWIWMVAGITLAIFEVFVPGYVFLGFAGGAVLTGVLFLIAPSIGLAPAVFVFAVASLAVWLVGRKLMGVRTGQIKVIDRDINED